MDADGLEWARKAAPSAELVHETATELPFPDATFDLVVLSDVLEHVGEPNQALVIRGARRELVSNGRLILTVPHTGITAVLDPMDMKRRFRRTYALYSRLSGYQSTTDPAIGHKHLRQADLKRLLDGFFTIQTIGFAGFLEPCSFGCKCWLNGCDGARLKVTRPARRN